MPKISEKPLATIGDLEAVYGSDPNIDESRATAVILQASNYLRQIAFNNRCDLDEKIASDSTGVYRTNVKMVVLAATQRVLTTPADVIPDATQWSQSASPYSESMSFAGGATGGNIYFKERELKLLGFRNVSGNRQFGALKGARA